VSQKIDKRLPEFEVFCEEQLSAASSRTYIRAVRYALKHYPADPSKLLLKKQLTKSSRHTYGAALRRWATFTKDEELQNILKSPEMQRSMKHDVQPFNEEEEKAIYAVLHDWKHDRTLPEWQWPAISMMFNLGLRAGADLAWLAKKDIEAAIKSGTSLIIVTKGSKERELPAAVVMEEMKCLLAIDEEWEILADLIVSIKSREDKFSRVKNAYERIRRCIKSLAEDAGIDPSEVHTHRLRHNFAQRVYSETGDILMVQRVLGHNNQNTTQGYLKKNTTIDVGERLVAKKKAMEEGED
jgi:integrase/recombinase XerD